jgi:DNA-binding MarR family transcriptional regulator
MNSQNEQKSEISAILQDNTNISSKHKALSCDNLARGVGFEPSVKPELLSKRIFGFLVSNGVSSLRDVYEALEEEPNRVDECLRRLWKRGLVLRTREPSFEFETRSRGRAGVTGYTRAINYYAINNGNELPGNFVKYNERKEDGRSRDVESKAYEILNYLINNKEKAFYSNDIVKALGVKSCDIMANVRRFEKKGLVYVRGYQTHDGRSPFRKGFLLTFIDQDKSRDTAVREAFERTDKMLLENPTSNTIHERVRLIRDQLLTTNELLSLSYFKNILGCDVDSTKRALRRARQLYSDIEQAKIFDRFTYYYLKSMKPEDLAANIEMKRNYIRVRFGRDNRIGHNWEACAEWFIDKFTEGAEFFSQNHRKNMDSRRITLHLLKQVGDRKQNAEVDRVWKVTPGLFSPTVIYVLECKWSIVTRKTPDEFLEVLKWSTDFGVDTENGRELKNGVVPVFAAGTYNPKEKVVVNGEQITLAQYANRMNIKLLRPADFNEKLRDHGIDKRLTTQSICRICRDEREIRELLNSIWKEPQKAQEHLTQTSQMNNNVFLFEKLLNT